MFLPWLTGGIAALDLFIKDEIEREGTEEFPRDFPGTKGFIRIHKSYNPGFPFGFMKERPQLVKGIPLAVTSAAAGALAALFTKKGCVEMIHTAPLLRNPYMHITLSFQNSSFLYEL